MKQTDSPAEPPLWSMVSAMALILVTPFILYALAPPSPLREGDTVFADGEQRVKLTTPRNVAGHKDETCLLDPNSPLIISRITDDPLHPSLVAHVQGNQTGEWPFCPVHAEVRLSAHQVFQKPPLFETIRQMLLRVLSPSSLARQ